MSGISGKEPLCGSFPYSTPETYERQRAMTLMLMLGKVPTKENKKEKDLDQKHD